MTPGDTQVNRGRSGHTAGTNGCAIATRGAILTTLFLLMIVTGAAFNFGLSPADADKGVREPGERFFTSFYLVTEETDPVNVDITASDADINTVIEDRQQNFSEQSCGDCIEFLNGGGPMEDDGANVEQWKNIEFFVTIPEDAEPGYHAIEVTPQPQRSGGGGGVEVVSSVSFPVTYRVPGEAIRDGQILGVHAGRNVDGRQRVITVFHNTGTVTMEVTGEITVHTVDGNRTIQTGTTTVSPSNIARLTAHIDTDELAVVNNDTAKDTFTVHASVDYTTGEDRHTTSLRPTDPITIQGATVQDDSESSTGYTYVILLVLLLVSTFTTWKVMTRARP